MADFEWRDPLLITADVTSLKQQDPIQIRSEFACELPSSNRFGASSMDNSDELSSPAKIDGRLALGFSLTSPDLVCMGSPDIANQMYEESPQFLSGGRIDVSLENGIEGSEIRDSFKNSVEKMEDLSTEASFELVAPPLADKSPAENSSTVIGINVGSTKEVELEVGINFFEDSHFSGGDTLATEDAVLGDGEGLSLYQSARVGNFSYHLEDLEPGFYVVDFHFAEIVFTSGPSGMRVFDVFLQEQKVVSSLDIYARVGANTPLVIPDLKTCISKDKGLAIRFEGVIGKPIVSGIYVRKDSSESFVEVELAEEVEFPQIPQHESLNDARSCSVDGDLQELEMECALLKKDLSDTKRALEELKRENELKNRECEEAWKSLKDLQNELMRKSMHVGSLAFAIEGQVKEKSRWFSSLRDLTRKLKILKMDHISLCEEASSFKQYLAEMEDVRSIVESTMNQHTRLHEDSKVKFLQEVKEKKELYNKVLELKGNIRVFCRCRPLNTQEIDEGASIAVDFEAAKDGELTVKSNGISKKIFKFDAVFSPEVNQVDVFEETAPLVASVLDGYNVCIFAYGQTGTGKTFTMEGTNEARGVNYRTLERLFDIIEERKNTFQYEVSVSVLEVYNEQIRDLLASDSLPSSTKRLEIKQLGEGGHHVPGLVEACVNTVSEVWDVLRTGSNGRAVGSTNANEHSSRSHCMHYVMVKGENLLNGECTRSKLWLVDLAGSERIAKTEVQGDRLKETQNINRSLSALGDVISALATKSPHIPFRNSKLTHLLQDSLGGDSKSLMFVQISPNENDLPETLCSLNFASRVRGIELGQAKKQMDRAEYFKYKQMADKLKQDLKSRELQVKKLEDTNYGLEAKIKERDVKNRNLQEKIKELESQLLVERKLARQHVDTKIAEQHQRQEEHNRESVRAPLATKALTIDKSEFETKDQASKASLSSGSGEFSFRPPSLDGFSKNDDLMDKENNPEIADQMQLPKLTGRASLCPTLHHTYTATAPRRNSLIPRPSLPGAAHWKSIRSVLPPLTPIQADAASEVTCLPEQIPCDSPKDQRNKTKKLSSALRKSLQRKIHTKSPILPPLRRVGVNVGMDKLRISIGNRGKMGQRMFLGNARRGVPRDAQQKQNHREKERGWNIGTATRTLL